MLERLFSFSNISWNLNGLRTRSKLIRVHTVLKGLDFPDIAAFQETHSDIRLGKKYKQKFSQYKIVTAHGATNSRGVALLVKKTLNFTVLQTYIDPEGRYIFLKGRLNSDFFTIGTLYANSEGYRERKQFFTKILDYNLGDNNHLYLGDFNAVESHSLDRANHNNIVGGDNEFKQFINLTNSIEVYRHLHKDGREYSYARHKDRGPFSRIDHALLTKGLESKVKRAQYVSTFDISDHKLLLVEITLGKDLIGHDFRKIRPEIFSTEKFTERFNKFWYRIKTDFYETLLDKIDDQEISSDILDNLPEEIDEMDFSPYVKHLDLNNTWWENFKNEIQKIGFQVQKEELFQRNYETRLLVKRLERTKNPRARDRINKQLLKSLQALNQQDWVDSTIFHQLKNEKCSKEFFQQFEKIKNNLYIDEIEDDDENILSTHQEKIDYLVKKYTELYNMDFPIMNDPHKQVLYEQFFRHLPNVSEVPQNTDDISISEVEEAVKSSLNNKCPGPDGIRAEFYKKFFPTIGPYMTAVFNNVFNSDPELIPNYPPSWALSVMKLIPKMTDSELDRIIANFKNLRPLQMSNVDRKKYADVLCKRLLAPYKVLINSFQTGGVPNRSVQSNILLLHLIINYLSLIGEKAFIFAEDKVKAFDSVNRDFLFAGMEYVGIKTKLINALKNLYSGTTSKILINGRFSNIFDIVNGVLQGCPLSALLFVGFMEALARAIHAQTAIEAIKLPNNRLIKIIMHMDDTTFLLKNKTSVELTLDIIARFNYVSGSKINELKSKIIHIGHDGSVDKIKNIKVVAKGTFVKILGIYFSDCVEEYSKENWRIKDAMVRDLVELWKNEDLTLIGKTLITNIKILSKLEYMLPVIDMPDKSYYKTIYANIRSFLNKGAVNIGLENLMLPKDKGGVGLVNICDRVSALRIHMYKACFYESTCARQQNTVCLVKYFLFICLRYTGMTYNNTRSIQSCGPLWWGHKDSMFRKSKFLEKSYNDLLIFAQYRNRLIKPENQELCLKELDTNAYFKFLRDLKEPKRFQFYSLDFQQLKKAWVNNWCPMLDHKNIVLNLRMCYNTVQTNTHTNNAVKTCYYCNKVENIQGFEQTKETRKHLFIECPVASQTWDYIKRKLINNNLPIYGHTKNNHGTLDIDKAKVLYKIGCNVTEAYLLSEITFILWKNRCANQKENLRQNHIDVIASLKNKLRIKVNFARRQFSENKFHTQWDDTVAFLEAITS